MMSMEIERISSLDTEALSGEFYFSSLIEEAQRRQQMSGGELDRLQLECMQLLDFKIRQYTGGLSSSVRVELAQSLLQSNAYTIGLYLKSLPDADTAVEALKTESLSELYRAGRKLIDTKLKTARFYHAKVLRSLTRPSNAVYDDTLMNGISGFFKLYDADFAAHDIHITADYPLCCPVTDIAGVEFIIRYLEAVSYENEVCRCFAPTALHRLFKGYDANYRECIFNVFEQVLTCAIGCVLLKADCRELSITAAQREQLFVLLNSLTREEVEVRVGQAGETLINHLKLSSEGVCAYLRRAVSCISPAVAAAVRTDTLESVFYPSSYAREQPRVTLNLTAKMENAAYRRLLCEFNECRYVSDRLAMIEREISSFADLDDLLRDAELPEDTLTAVLAGLDVTGLAAFVKKYELGEEGREDFCSCLRRAVASLPHDQQSAITRLASQLELQ